MNSLLPNKVESISSVEFPEDNSLRYTINDSKLNPLDEIVSSEHEQNLNSIKIVKETISESTTHIMEIDEKNNNVNESSKCKNIENEHINSINDNNQNMLKTNIENVNDFINKNIDVVTKKIENIELDAKVDNSKPSSVTKQLLIEYVEGQWSPLNQEGKKFYSFDQMLKLKDDPKCKEKPANLPENCEVSLKEIREQNRNEAILGKGFLKPFSGNGNENNLLPAFAKSNLPQRGGGGGPFQGKRSSQQGNKQQSGNKNSSKSDIIHVSLSLREDIKLNETENAWKPTILSEENEALKGDQGYQKLLKNVRGILNKLTPEKFQTLLAQLKNLTMDTPAKLKGVIELIFEKAVDEPNFAVAYAEMCSELSKAQKALDPGPKIDSNMSFRVVLLHTCQEEFEKILADQRKASRYNKIEDCKDPDKKLELEEEDRKLRRRSVGTIRFIGELFKFELLTMKILMKCIEQFLENEEHEESLECLCKLLTTVGKIVHTKDKVHLDKFVEQMQEIVKKKSQNISSRVRFMLQDVIDLKKTGWVPRRQDLNPKKMGEIQKEAEKEQLKEQLMNYPTSRKVDHHFLRGGGNNSGNNNSGSGGNMYLNKNNRHGSEDGWLTTPSKNRSSPYSSLDPSKLNHKALVSKTGNYLSIFHLNYIKIAFHVINSF